MDVIDLEELTADVLPIKSYRASTWSFLTAKREKRRRRRWRNGVRSSWVASLLLVAAPMAGRPSNPPLTAAIGRAGRLSVTGGEMVNRVSRSWLTAVSRRGDTPPTG